MECDDAEDLSSSRGTFFFFPLIFSVKNHPRWSLMVSHLHPPLIWSRGVGVGGGGVGSVLAKMTRRKPDQRRRSFCERVTAGARDGCEGRGRSWWGGRTKQGSRKRPAPDLQACSGPPGLLQTSRLAPGLLQTCSRPAPDLQACSRPAPGLQAWSRPAPDLLQACSRPAPDLLQTFRPALELQTCSSRLS